MNNRRIATRLTRQSSCYDVFNLEFTNPGPNDLCIEGTLFTRDSLVRMHNDHSRIISACRPTMFRLSLISGDYYVPNAQIIYIINNWNLYSGYNLKIYLTDNRCRNTNVYHIYGPNNIVPNNRGFIEEEFEWKGLGVWL